MLNKAMVIGNLGADPEMRYTANGSAVTEFRVASTRKFKRNEESVEETEWFRVVTWNRLAEVCSQYLTKGRQVYVEGRLRTRSWEGQDGVTRYTTEVIAHEVKFLGNRNGGGGGDAPSAATVDDGLADDGLADDDLPF